MEPLYTTSATAAGGRFEGRVRAERGTFDLEVNPPGHGTGTNPEELFAAGYAACFANAVVLTARRMKLDPTGVEVRAGVTLGKLDDGGYGIAVRLDVSAPAVDGPSAQALVERAHVVCPYSRATRGNVDVEVVVRGSAGVASG